MSQLAIFDSNPGRELFFHLKKQLSTIGSDRMHDLYLASSCEGVHFSLIQRDGAHEIHPGKAKIKLNGNRLSRPTLLRSCDRLEWESFSAVYISSDMQMDSAAGRDMPSLRILQNLTNSLESCTDFGVAFNQLLDTLIELSGAEDGMILSDLGETTGWSVVASRGLRGVMASGSTKQIFSDTLLSRVLETRELVYIESIIGNSYADAQSIIQGKVFSAACLPLMVGERILGAVFLHTYTPGRSIQRAMLLELKVLATQAALMLISSNEITTQRRENQDLKRKLPESESAFVYRHPLMAEVVRTVSRLAASPLNILVIGATGTGKEIAAKEVHRLSSRKDKPFVAINCAAIPVTLLESTLFGYEKGAFTGADRASIGKFEQANGGTLFLDEIGDLPLELQAKLLRVLQEKAVDPIGAKHPRPIDVRVVAATHRDLDSMITKGQFRQDLYFRLAGAKIKLPAVKDRGEDIVLLAEHLLKRMAPGKSLSEEAKQKLLSHTWPGNVRELEHVVTRAAVLSESNSILASDMEIESWAMSGAASTALDVSGTLEQAQQRFTLRLVQEALEKNDGNRALTAKNLGISERTLYRILADAADASEPASHGS